MEKGITQSRKGAEGKSFICRRGETGGRPEAGRIHFGQDPGADGDQCFLTSMPTESRDDAGDDGITETQA
jgi:hypothetical protein